MTAVPSQSGAGLETKTTATNKRCKHLNEHFDFISNK